MVLAEAAIERARSPCESRSLRLRREDRPIQARRPHPLRVTDKPEEPRARLACQWKARGADDELEGLPRLGAAVFACGIHRGGERLATPAGGQVRDHYGLSSAAIKKMLSA